MKNKIKSRRRPRGVTRILWNGVDPSVLSALVELAHLFPATDVGTGKKSPMREQPVWMVRGLVMLALANIEIVSPMIQSMVDYCAKEGINNQHEYLCKQIDLKFKSKLHRKSVSK